MPATKTTTIPARSLGETKVVFPMQPTPRPAPMERVSIRQGGQVALFEISRASHGTGISPCSSIRRKCP